MKATLANITWHLRKCEHCDGTGSITHDLGMIQRRHRVALLICRECHGSGLIRSLTGEAAAQYQRDWRARNEARK